MYPGAYAAKSVQVRPDGRITAYVPQLFGDTIIVIGSFTGTTPSGGEMGWVVFQSGDPEFPVWISGVDDTTQAEIAGIQEEIAGTQAEIAGIQEEIAGTQAEIAGTQEEIAGIQDDVTSLGVPRGWVPWTTLTSTSPAQVYLDGTLGEPVPEPGFTKIRFAGRFSASTYAWTIAVFDLHASYINNAQAYDFTGIRSGGLNDTSRSSIWFGYVGPSVSAHVEATIHLADTSTPYLVSESQIRGGLDAGGAAHQRVHAHGTAGLSTPFTVISFGTNTGSINTLELEFELYYP